MAEIVSTVWIVHVTDAYMCIAVKDNARGGMTMTEYIKREDAIDTVLDIYFNTPDINLSCEKFEAAIRKIPAADVVPVVRCQECKYRFRNNGHEKSGCPIIDTNIWMDDDDFCSHGERKEGAE